MTGKNASNCCFAPLSICFDTHSINGVLECFEKNKGSRTIKLPMVRMVPGILYDSRHHITV